MLITIIICFVKKDVYDLNESLTVLQISTDRYGICTIPTHFSLVPHSFTFKHGLHQHPSHPHSLFHLIPNSFYLAAILCNFCNNPQHLFEISMLNKKCKFISAAKLDPLGLPSVSRCAKHSSKRKS